MNTEAPDIEKLSTDQRTKLLTFIERADAIIGDGDFDSGAEWTDAKILALSLRSAGILGFTDDRLEQLFRVEFGIAGVTEDELGDWLAVIMLVDAERRILAGAGGRN